MTDILVVEDDAIICHDIQTTLQRLGYRVPRTAQSGSEALESLDIALPDLVLMDIRLKGKLDGIQTTSLIRKQWDLPVVYLTSYSDDATIARAKETGPHGYLLKPFNERDLRTTIEVAIRKHELELKLAERERWFSTTLESIGDAVIATDPLECITFMNPIAEALTGWKSQDARGRAIGDVFTVVDRDGVPLASIVGKAIREGFRVELPPDTHLVSKQGVNKDVDDSSAPIIDDRGRVLGGVAVFRDVTERKQLEQRLAISERLASVGTMAAGMAHEINNPLSAVIGNVGYALEELARLTDALKRTDDVQAALAAIQLTVEALSDAESAGNRVRRIVQDLRKFARADEVATMLLDLPNVVDEALKLTEHQVRHHAKVVRRFGTTPLVEANEGRLVQVVTNLIMNAAQAIGEGAAGANEIVVSTRTDDAGRAELEVRDTGPGISKRDAARIFDPFFTTKPVGTGTGLGLSICHSIITALGGEIRVHSELGCGTTFKVAIPPASAVVVHRRVTTIPPPTVRRGRVLSIDDEDVVVRVVQRLLTDFHDVFVENDAHAALARIAEGQRFDVILCDLMMPGMTGVDFYEAISSVDPDLAARIVFVTGGSFSPRTTAFLKECSNTVVSKPFKVDELRAVVASYVADDQAPRRYLEQNKAFLPDPSAPD